MQKYTKSMLKEFRRGFGRFIAIMAIIALGVGFLIGLMQATPDMKNTMNAYYRDNAMYDINIKGTYGLSAKDIDAIGNAKDEDGNVMADNVMGFIQTDVSVSVGSDRDVVARINGLDSFEEEIGQEIVHLTLEEGRFPAAANECVVERSNLNFEEIKVGATVSITDPTAGTYGDVYAQTQFTVVGVVSSPAYYYLNGKEVTSVGNGVVGTVLYVPREAYKISTPTEEEPLGHLTGGTSVFGQGLFDLLNGNFIGVPIVYTDCYVTLNESAKYGVFDQGYKDTLAESTETYEDLAASDNVSNATINEKLEQFSAFIGDMAQADWYVLDTVNTNVSYISFNMNVDKVSDIAAIFPVFFILVAALVAMTSMTRMVEEDRTEIGTLKALGYSNGRIAAKYLIYCLSAGIIGGLVGLLCGFALLPSIFWMAYQSQYYLPPLTLGVSPVFTTVVLICLVALTIAVTVYACWATLRERPSLLMQQKAPKQGKRVLLERVGFLWKPLKFKYKAAIRNIFRYKKNMFMTIISVMGCTALILAGFGIYDSINVINNVQYTELVRYDMEISYKSENIPESLDEFLAGKTYVPLYTENMNIVVKSEDGSSARESVEVLVASDRAALDNVVSVRDRKSKDLLELPADGIVLPENVAEAYDLKTGDRVTLRASDGKEKEASVTVYENYVESRAYMSTAAYTALFEEDTVQNNVLFVCADLNGIDQEELARDLLSDENVTGVAFTDDEQDIYAGLSQTMGYIIAVLIVSAGALAAIVLYNLTNINIDERQREIATLKVLGYTRAEVAGYVYRESAILTIAGSLLGLLLGWLLHTFFMVPRIDSVALLLGRTISVWSFFYSFGLTVLFAAIVYAFMLIKLNKINPAEALKSIE